MCITCVVAAAYSVLTAWLLIDFEARLMCNVFELSPLHIDLIA